MAGVVNHIADAGLALSPFPFGAFVLLTTLPYLTLPYLTILMVSLAVRTLGTSVRVDYSLGGGTMFNLNMLE